MARKNKALVAILEEMLDAARSGELAAAFIVYQRADGTHDACYETDDLGDLLLQVRTEVIRAQLPVEIAEQAADRLN
jgi:hypothetical protein